MGREGLNSGSCSRGGRWQTDGSDKGTFGRATRRYRGTPCLPSSALGSGMGGELGTWGVGGPVVGDLSLGSEHQSWSFWPGCVHISPGGHRQEAVR